MWSNTVSQQKLKLRRKRRNKIVKKIPTYWKSDIHGHGMSRYVTVCHGLSRYVNAMNEFEKRPAKNGNTSPKGSWMGKKIIASSFTGEKLHQGRGVILNTWVKMNCVLQGLGTGLGRIRMLSSRHGVILWLFHTTFYLLYCLVLAFINMVGVLALTT